MNTNNQQTKRGLLLGFGVALLLLPAIAVANQSSANSISSITTSGSGSTVEISNTTSINGKRTTYTFATTTKGNVSHQVEITDGVVTKEETSVVAPGIDRDDEVPAAVVASRVSTAVNNATATYTPLYLETPANIRWLESIINYLHFYVEQLF
jgi:hypothetical protein